MPGRIKQADDRPLTFKGHQGVEMLQGILSHTFLDILTRLIQLFEGLSERQCLLKVRGDETFNADAHVIKTSGGIQPWANLKA